MAAPQGGSQGERAMPIRPGLLEILVRPEARQTGALASEASLEELHREIGGEGLRKRRGERVTAPIAEGLVREDGRILYPIDDGIPVMLIEESIELA